MKTKKWMMRFLRATLGYFLAGFAVPGFWPYLASPFGYLAGFVAALCLIGPVWYLVHYRGLVYQEAEAIAVDMGGGIAAAVFTRDSLYHGFSEMLAGLPTLFLMLLGACLGGFLALFLERRRKERSE